MVQGKITNVNFFSQFSFFYVLGTLVYILNYCTDQIEFDQMLQLKTSIALYILHNTIQTSFLKVLTSLSKYFSISEEILKDNCNFQVVFNIFPIALGKIENT